VYTPRFPAEEQEGGDNAVTAHEAHNFYQRCATALLPTPRGRAASCGVAWDASMRHYWPL
jgi:hypothetical protein